MDSNRRGKWSISEGENAVKTAFFIWAMDGQDLPSMRYVDIREAIRRQNRPIGDRTLIKALNSLIRKGELTKDQKDGRKTGYSLKVKLDRETKVTISADADMARIRYCSLSGVVFDSSKGWAFYGVPKVIANRIRPELRKEALRFQGNVYEILETEFERFVGVIEGKTKDRTSKEVIEEGLDALRNVYWSFAGKDRESYSTDLALSLLEKMSPGSVPIVINKILQDSRFGRPEYEEAQIRYWARVENVSEEEMENEWRSAKKSWRAVQRLFEVLNGRDRARAYDEVGGFLIAGMELTAVVR